MPQLGESVTEGTITRWLKNVGDTVKVDEAIVEVSTDKVDTEIPSPVAGVILEIKAAQDDVIAVGSVMAVIGESNSSATPATPSTPVAPKVEPVVTAPVVTAPVVVAPVVVAPVIVKEVPEPAPVVQSTSTPSGASVNVVLPQLGESVTEGTITRWLKKVGDSIALDEAIVEISTDKVDTELPSPAAGIIAEIKVAQDEVAPVGVVLAVISSSSISAPVQPVQVIPTPPAPKVEPVVVKETAMPAPVAPVVVVEQVKPAPVVFAQTSNGTKSEVYASPIARQIAREKGIDLSKVSASTTSGRISKEDVVNATATTVLPTTTSTQTFTPSPTPASAPPANKVVASEPVVNTPSLRGKIEQTSRLRKIIAQRMVESLHISAQLTSVIEVDVTKIATLRNKVKESFAAKEGVKLSYLPFFAKVTIDCLKEFPIVNATISSDASEITYSDAQHLAVAVDTPRGLLVPVIRDAGDLSIAGLARKIQDVATRTRDNKVTPDELSGGTFTLTNTGSRGALFDTPIINQPQVGILGTGAVVKRPVVLKGDDGADQIAIRQMVYLALTYDHRLVDGADAARFLSSMKLRLEEANFESELGL
jgi:2-oxoglutarate dehydrogenase E2 component (dihydrolipoamide succinyltransferase)